MSENCRGVENDPDGNAAVAFSLAAVGQTTDDAAGSVAGIPIIEFKELRVLDG